MKAVISLEYFFEKKNDTFTSPTANCYSSKTVYTKKFQFLQKWRYAGTMQRDEAKETNQRSFFKCEIHS